MGGPQLLDEVGPSKEVWLCLVMLYCQVGRPDLAIPAARKAVEAFPTDPDLRVLLASSLSYAPSSFLMTPVAASLRCRCL